MSWADARIKEYREGRESTWIERRALEHAEPVHMVLATVGLMFLVYGLWTHDWIVIGAGVVLNVVGHIYTWIRS